MADTSQFDAAVVGAGPAGSALARRLALQGCRVALIERSRFDAPRVGESLAPAVQPLLSELDVWRQFLALDPVPSHGTRSLWGDAEPHVHSHLTSRWGCGWHVDRRAFDSMLAQAASAAGAVLCCETTAIRCDTRATGWELILRERTDEGSRERLSSIHATVVIDATGRSAALASSVGARRLPLDTLVAVATEFGGIATGSEGYVMIETTADGWWYTAPVPNGRMMAMLMTDGDLCGRADLACKSAWLQRLQMTAATQARVAGGAVSWGPRVFSARSHRLRRRDERGAWLAVGDAALAVDPISGSGVVRALRTARAAADTVLAVLSGHTTEPIEAYETDRDQECTAYLRERAMYYGIEQRWSSSPFWQRRSSALNADAFMSRSDQDLVGPVTDSPQARPGAAPPAFRTTLVGNSNASMKRRRQ